jgi:hypothetical protein
MKTVDLSTVDRRKRTQALGAVKRCPGATYLPTERVWVVEAVKGGLVSWGATITDGEPEQAERPEFVDPR